ncbi:MAG: hypothetical protein IPK80_23140 [Nannocystis sp.]|nr:hypothetical protein [Nannocystis sp.]
MHPPLDLLPSQPAPDDLQTEVFRRDHPQFPARPPALRVVPPPMGEATTLLGGVDPTPRDLTLATEVLPGMGGDHLPPPRLATSPSSALQPPPTPTPTPPRPSIAHHPKFLIVLTILVALTTATSVALAILIIRDRTRLLPPPPTATSIVVDRADRLLRPLLDHLHARPPADAQHLAIAP